MLNTSSNPVLSDRVFENVRPIGTEDVMTIEGTVNKSIFAVLLAMGMAYWTYYDPTLSRFMIPAFIIGLVSCIVLIFKMSLAPYLTPIYAAAQGIVVGTISTLYAANFGDGIVFQALSLTFATMFGMLVLYKTGVIKVTERFRSMVLAAGFGLMLVYIVGLVMSLFGSPVSFLHGTSAVSIGISFFAVGIASLFLVLDFDRISQVGASGRAPKYMEWYCAFGLLVTLIWLYLEMLKLLSKFQSRD